jgi:hypothetical protein
MGPTKEVDDIEVTPAMIEAGRREYDLRCRSWRTLSIRMPLRRCWGRFIARWFQFGNNGAV